MQRDPLPDAHPDRSNFVLRIAVAPAAPNPDTDAIAAAFAGDA